MDVEQFKEDARSGRIGVDRLVELVVSLQRQLQAAQRRIEELEKRLGRSTTKLDEPFSVRAEERRQEARGKKRRQRKRSPKQRGRLRTAEKIAQAQHTQQVFPDGVAKRDCKRSHTRPVWRLIDGQAVLVAYGWRATACPRNPSI